MKSTKPIHTLPPSQKASGRVDHSANEPLSFWERGWGEGKNGTFLPLGILKSYKKPRNHHDQMTCQQPLASAADSHRTANHRVRLGAPLPATTTELPPPLQSQTSSHTAVAKTLRIPAQNAARKLRYLACLLTLAALPALAANRRAPITPRTGKPPTSSKPAPATASLPRPIRCNSCLRSPNKAPGYKKNRRSGFFTSASKPRPATLHINTLKLLIGFTGINNALY